MIVNKTAPKAQSSGHILIVEDEAANKDMLAALLQRAGYTTDSAEDGEKAWQALLHHPNYTLVVTDRMMPHMDGLQLFNKIKKSTQLRHIPVIMQTGAKSADEMTQGVQAGVYYYLTKPYHEETLLSLVRSAIHDQETSNLFSEKIKKHKDTLNHLMRGVFHIRTLEDAQNLAFLLGKMFPRPEIATTGLYELMINGIEHGNLKVGFETKKKLLTNNTWERELTTRLESPENKEKFVRVEYMHEDDTLTITITDNGNGFDWQAFMEIEPSRATQPNGRGIAKANLLSFDRITYKGKGNEVVITHSLS